MLSYGMAETLKAPPLSEFLQSVDATEAHENVIGCVLYANSWLVQFSDCLRGQLYKEIAIGDMERRSKN